MCKAMVQAVSRRTQTVEARVRSEASPCAICVGKSGTGPGFSQCTSVFPVMCTKRAKGRSLRSCQKRKPFIKSTMTGYRSTFT